MAIVVEQGGTIQPSGEYDKSISDAIMRSYQHTYKEKESLRKSPRQGSDPLRFCCYWGLVSSCKEYTLLRGFARYHTYPGRWVSTKRDTANSRLGLLFDKRFGLGGAIPVR